MLPIKELSIMVSSYPVYDKTIKHNKSIDDVNKIIEIITKIRNTKQENNIGKEYFILNNLNEDEAHLFTDNIDIFNKLLKGDIVTSLDDKCKKINILLPYGTIILGYMGTDNEDDVIANLHKERDMLFANIERREKLLANVGYVNKAPKNIVDDERKKLEEEKNKITLINEKLKDM
jgi:valyl-tRNA synthetase